ncbi:MAG: DNA cytosine methyltransferase, partial [Microthrixaceae bacterium]
MAVSPQPRSIDLFCGAGGFTAGLLRAGVRSVLGSDVWTPAVETFEANFSGVPMLPADASELSGTDLMAASGQDAPPELLVGGPPCQGFSSAGSRVGDDPRNTLVGVFARLVAEVQPSAFIFENVEGFLTSAGGAYVTALLDPLVEAGYQIRLAKLNVANYGVP